MPRDPLTHPTYSKRMEGKLDELRSRVDRLCNKLDRVFEITTRILGVVDRKKTRTSRNANDYQSRKERKTAEEDARRARTVQNPDGSPFEVSRLLLWEVADAFATKNKIQLYLWLMDQEDNQAPRILTMLVRFWCEYYWEAPIKAYGGSQYAVFAGWTADRDSRLKARRATVVAAGDIVLKPGKFTTTRPWDGTKMARFGEPKMWGLLNVLVSRMLYKLQMGDDFEEVEEWSDVNEECLATLHLVSQEGYAFSDEYKDRLCPGNPEPLWRFDRDRFHRKVGKVLPQLSSIVAAFERGSAEAEAEV